VFTIPSSGYLVIVKNKGYDIDFITLSGDGWKAWLD